MYVTDRQTDRQSVSQTDRQTDRQTDSVCADRQLLQFCRQFSSPFYSIRDFLHELLDQTERQTDSRQIRFSDRIRQTDLNSIHKTEHIDRRQRYSDWQTCVYSGEFDWLCKPDTCSGGWGDPMRLTGCHNAASNQTCSCRAYFRLIPSWTIFSGPSLF